MFSHADPNVIGKMTRHSDFDTIARAIRFLEDTHTHQPPLEEIAGHMGISRFHLHRLFTRWAGVSPKRFLQFLTLENAKSRLRRAEPVLQTSLEVGLSGPSRLHDLFVNLEAVTPGQFKTGGEGLEIRWGVGDTPFGPALTATTPRGLCWLSFLTADDPGAESARAELAALWPQARMTPDDRAAEEILRRIFPLPDVAPPAEPLSLFVKGSNFQVRVWKALLAIPPGAVSTYGRLARHLGQPGAARAVGSAVAKNPLAYVIPCHRVIRESGHFGEYRWGSARKKAMLGWEASRGAA